MAQCDGKTKKGDRCKRDAREDSPFCAIHQDQEIRSRSAESDAVWDSDSIVKVAVGFGLVAAIFLLRFRR
jgi:hypothetical protein